MNLFKVTNSNFFLCGKKQPLKFMFPAISKYNTTVNRMHVKVAQVFNIHILPDWNSIPTRQAITPHAPTSSS